MRNQPKVYADFNKLDDDNRVILKCSGTFRDLKRQHTELANGLKIILYTDDADENNNPGELLVDGVVQFDEKSDQWVASVDWGKIRFVSF